MKADTKRKQSSWRVLTFTSNISAQTQRPHKPLTCNGVAKEVHLGSGQLRHWTLPSRIWIWKYSVMQALQYTCWHSLKQRHLAPSFSTKQIPQPNTLLSNTFCRCASSKSKSWGRRSARGSIKTTARGSAWEEDENFSFLTSFSEWLPHCVRAEQRRKYITEPNWK